MSEDPQIHPITEVPVTWQHVMSEHFFELAGTLCNLASTTDNPSRYYLGSTAFCAFALEAMANEYGDILVPKWIELYESSKPIGKLVLLAEKLDVPCDLGSQPWQSIIEVFKVRNEVAHSKPKTHTATLDLTKVTSLLNVFTHPSDRLSRYTETRTRELIRQAHTLRVMFFVHGKAKGLDISFLREVDQHGNPV